MLHKSQNRTISMGSCTYQLTSHYLFLQDLYQFIAKDVTPPFTFVVPHPRKPLPLSEVFDKPAKLYNNHLLLVEQSKGHDLMELRLLSDETRADVPKLEVTASNISVDRTCISEGESLLRHTYRL